jgi:hypothetical protein
LAIVGEDGERATQRPRNGRKTGRWIADIKNHPKRGAGGDRRPLQNLRIADDIEVICG